MQVFTGRLFPKLSPQGKIEHLDTHKLSKKRVTTPVCVNGTTEYKLHLIMIGKAMNPQAFKKIVTKVAIHGYKVVPKTKHQPHILRACGKITHLLANL